MRSAPQSSQTDMNGDLYISEKKEARKFFLEKRLALTARRLAAASAALCEGIVSLKEFTDADTLLIFFPSRNEPDLLPLVRIALSLEKNVAFPISFPDTCTLEFRCVSDLSELKEGTYGIPEPCADAPTPPITNKTLCILPALAFDRQGFRLGYGKGYYDRFLSQFKGVSAGAVIDGFLCDQLPIEHTDIPTDIIITEIGVIRIRCH